MPALAVFADWENLRPKTKVDGDLRATAEYIGLTTVIPTGPWVAELLKGNITLTTASYMKLHDFPETDSARRCSTATTAGYCLA